MLFGSSASTLRRAIQLVSLGASVVAMTGCESFDVEGLEAPLVTCHTTATDPLIPPSVTGIQAPGVYAGSSGSTINVVEASVSSTLFRIDGANFACSGGTSYDKIKLLVGANSIDLVPEDIYDSYLTVRVPAQGVATAGPQVGQTIALLTTPQTLQLSTGRLVGAQLPVGASAITYVGGEPHLNFRGIKGLRYIVKAAYNGSVDFQQICDLPQYPLNPCPIANASTGVITFVDKYSHPTSGLYYAFADTSSMMRTLTVVAGDVYAKPKALASGGDVTCAKVHETAPEGDEGVQCWGYNGDGQLGNGGACADTTTCTRSTVPTQPIGLTSQVQAIAAGAGHTCAVQSNIVRCWGRNDRAQLGQAAGGASRTPLALTTAIANPKAVTVGDRHSCALSSDGSVRCWGDNSAGQLGLAPNGTTYATPQLVTTPALGQVTQISAGANHTCALNTSGRVLCWGANNDATVLGDSTLANFTRVSAISAGGDHTCLLQDGVPACWGSNTNGELGHIGGASGSPEVVYVFAQDAAVSSIATGTRHSCAVSMGRVYCWGGNAQYQLGAEGADSVNPIHVSSVTGFVEDLTAGAGHTCVLVDGKVKCWGAGAVGQLGAGATTPRSAIATQVVSLQGRATQVLELPSASVQGSGAETGGTLNIAVTRPTSGAATTIHVTAIDLDAIAGAYPNGDYVLSAGTNFVLDAGSVVAGTLTLPSGATSAIIPVTYRTRDAFNHSFKVVLDRPALNATVRTLVPATLAYREVLVSLNASPSLTAQDWTIPYPDASFTFEIIRSGVATSAASVNYVVTGIQPNGGSCSGGVCSWPAGSSANRTLTWSNNLAHPVAGSTISIALSSASCGNCIKQVLWNGTALPLSNARTIQLTVSPGPAYSLEYGNYAFPLTTNGYTGSAIRVKRSNVATSDNFIDYTVSGNSATCVMSPSSGSNIRIPAGQASVALPDAAGFNLRNLTSGACNFTVSITPSAGDPGAVVAPSTANVQIDAPGTIGGFNSAFNVYRSGNQKLTIYRSGNTGVPVTLTYWTRSGGTDAAETARSLQAGDAAPYDYVGTTAQTVTFAIGETFKDIWMDGRVALGAGHSTLRIIPATNKTQNALSQDQLTSERSFKLYLSLPAGGQNKFSDGTFATTVLVNIQPLSWIRTQGKDSGGQCRPFAQTYDDIGTQQTMVRWKVQRKGNGDQALTGVPFTVYAPAGGVSPYYKSTVLINWPAGDISERHVTVCLPPGYNNGQYTVLDGSAQVTVDGDTNYFGFPGTGFYNPTPDSNYNIGGDFSLLVTSPSPPYSGGASLIPTNQWGALAGALPIPPPLTGGIPIAAVTVRTDGGWANCWGSTP